MTDDNDDGVSAASETDLEIMDEIPQSVLMEYLRLQNRFAFIKESIKASLERGARVERGDITAKIQRSSRRSPKWKEELQKIVGADKIKEITEMSPAVQIVALKIDVDKNAVISREELT
jgi:hypothetical protein